MGREREADGGRDWEKDGLDYCLGERYEEQGKRGKEKKEGNGEGEGEMGTAVWIVEEEGHGEYMSVCLSCLHVYLFLSLSMCISRAGCECARLEYVRVCLNIFLPLVATFTFSSPNYLNKVISLDPSSLMSIQLLFYIL